MAASRKFAITAAPQTGGSASGKGGNRTGGGSMSNASSQPGSSSAGLADLTAQGQEVVGQAQEQASKLVGVAREQATTQLATQKERAAGTLGALATALHDTSRQVRDRDETAMADYVDLAAIQVERMVNVLKEQDIDQLIATTTQFARRQPGLFFAAAIGAGFAAARFLRSSSQSESGQMGTSGFGTSRDWSAQYDAGYGRGYASGVENTSGFDASLVRGAGSGFGAVDAESSGQWQVRSSFARGPEEQ